MFDLVTSTCKVIPMVIHAAHLTTPFLLLYLTASVSCSNTLLDRVDPQIRTRSQGEQKGTRDALSRASYKVELPMLDGGHNVRRDSHTSKTIRLTLRVGENETIVDIDDAVYFRPTDRIMYRNVTSQDAVNTTLQDQLDQVKSQDPASRKETLRLQYQTVLKSFQELQKARPAGITRRSGEYLSLRAWLELLIDYQAEISADVQRYVDEQSEELEVRLGHRPRTSQPPLPSPTATPRFPRRVPPTLLMSRFAVDSVMMFRLGMHMQEWPFQRGPPHVMLLDTVVYVIAHWALTRVEPILQFLDEARALEFAVAMVLTWALFALVTLHDLVMVGANPLLQPPSMHEVDVVLNRLGLVATWPLQDVAETGPVPEDSIVRALQADEGHHDAQQEPSGLSETLSLPSVTSRAM